MSHDIEQAPAGPDGAAPAGTAAFVSARIPAWHQLGTVFEREMTAAEVLREAHLAGWNVRTNPLQTTVLTVDGVTTLDVPDRFAVIRNSPFEWNHIDVLGVVGNYYQVVQNEEHAEFLDTLVDASGAHFETAGSLNDGKRVFVTMKLPEGIKVGGQDPVDLYLAALNGHDGTTSFTVMVTPVRVVCANTLAAAFGNHRSMFKIRHTTQVKGRISEARRALDLTFAYVEDFAKAAERMVNTTVSQTLFNRIITEKVYVGDPDATNLQARRRDELIGQLNYLFTVADTQAGIRNTAWAGYQAVTEYLDHYSSVRGDRDAADVRALRTITAADVRERKEQAFTAFATL